MTSDKKTTATPGVVEAALRGYRLTQLVHVAAKLGIADVVASSPSSAAEIAERVGANPDAIRRLMRTLFDSGLFARNEQGEYVLTPESEKLRSGTESSIRPAAIMHGEPWWWDAWGGLFDCVRTGRTAFDIVHGMSLFDYLSTKEEASDLFNQSMRIMTEHRAAAITTAYDLGKAKVLADIGGGHGSFLHAAMERFSALKTVLFDNPKVVEGARQRLSSFEQAGRCQIVGGDFFASVPSGADTYSIKDILHDWNDEQAMLILSNIRRAIPEDGHLLVIERVLADDDRPSPGNWIDMSMLVLTGGRERTESEYRTLLSESGFQVRRLLPVDAETTIIEAAPQ